MLSLLFGAVLILKENNYRFIVWIVGHIDRSISASVILQQIFLYLHHWLSTCGKKYIFSNYKKRPCKIIEQTSKYSMQIFHAFLFNIRKYSPEVINIQQREAELNIKLPRVNNIDINGAL